jgi:hypothetical protein
LLKDSINYYPDESIEFINSDFQQWIDNTNKQYGVNLLKFGFQYADYWYTNYRLWESKCRIVENREFGIYFYEWKKAKDPFSLSILYSKYKHLPYIKNHKKDLEIVVMYFWLTSICGPEEDFNDYLNSVQSDKMQQ